MEPVGQGLPGTGVAPDLPEVCGQTLRDARVREPPGQSVPLPRHRAVGGPARQNPVGQRPQVRAARALRVPRSAPRLVGDLPAKVQALPVATPPGQRAPLEQRERRRRERGQRHPVEARRRDRHGGNLCGIAGCLGLGPCPDFRPDSRPCRGLAPRLDRGGGRAFAVLVQIPDLGLAQLLPIAALLPGQPGEGEGRPAVPRQGAVPVLLLPDEPAEAQGVLRPGAGDVEEAHVLLQLALRGEQPLPEHRAGLGVFLHLLRLRPVRLRVFARGARNIGQGVGKAGEGQPQRPGRTERGGGGAPRGVEHGDGGVLQPLGCVDRGDEDGVGVRVHPVRLLHAGAVPQGALHPPRAAGQADGESPLIGPGQGERAPDVSERAEPMVRDIAREPVAVPDKALQQGRGAPVTPQQFEADQPIERLGDALAQQVGQRPPPPRAKRRGASLEEAERLLPRDPREGREQPARQGRLVPGVRGRAQQRDDVAHLAAGKVFRASVQPHGDPLRRERALQKAVMVPVPEQHRKVPPECGPKPPLRLVPHGTAGSDGVPDARGERRGQAPTGVLLTAAGSDGEQDRKGSEGPPAALRWGRGRGERLVGQSPQPGGGAEPGAPDMGKQTVDPPQEGSAGPEAHVQLDPFVRLGDGPGEERRVRVAEAVDGLFGVPDGEEPRASAFPQGLQQGELEGVRILKFVHQDVAELPGGAHPFRRAPGVEDHVGERQEPSPPLHLIPKAPGRPAETEERGAQAAFRLREGLVRGWAGQDGELDPLLFLAPIARRRSQDVPDGGEELSCRPPEVPKGVQDVQREEAQGLVVGLPGALVAVPARHPRHPELRAGGDQCGGAFVLALRTVLVRLIGKLSTQSTEH